MGTEIPRDSGEAMNDRIHRYLDGELSKGDLTEDELREAAYHETVIRETATAFEEVDVPDLTARVMMRLPAEAQDAVAASTAQPAVDRVVSAGAGGAGALVGAGGGAGAVAGAGGAGALAGAGGAGALVGVLAWLWNPRPIQLRPAWGMVAAAFMGLALWGNLPLAPHTDSGFLATNSDSIPQAATGAVATERVFVQFRLDVGEATAVKLAGSFTGWEAEYALHETAPGVWSILVPLEPGVHDYAFIIDGERWMSDPTAPTVDDGFGGVNSRLSVLLPTGFNQS